MSLKYATTKCVPLREGIWGMIGDPTCCWCGLLHYEEDPVAFPIDVLVINLTKEDGQEDEQEAM